ncbi:hypothetical protein GobsT_31490 [Gemmata obscuriglobus]|uniref:DUF1549 domain-containing protein n=1 Tax=Gemmata obscuriglobus TaxID=114 RepID=A0A2Z3H6K7_9BACT|nr:DUF1549 domain-containing protein [Gemmata obscuriglobus]AWM38665.1 DUF1549 domain-containing protein [Gemmata obscuriglobus]QEG28372.1 hypothetical protein GobsT_31490 [Gemmata obscuriglobus]VTS06281.1 Uncharacterized protein OS=Singulisphaera acidiphila (strain ATCC BAA-1392 / DSM 18658 / VKM B-2454 / MOB10) GN=Sinac_2922 PE=4 SV=1: PSCyt2: PSCyt2: PSD1 [Gemmata obscuriglobus UQM 2246]
MTRYLLLLGALLVAAGPSVADDEPKPLTGGISPQTAKINEFIAKGWEAAGAKPAAKASDHEYMRRVFIDLIGRIPTVEEIRDFEQDRAANKRVRLVQRLLNERKYAPKSNGRPVTAVAGLSKFPIDYSAAYARNFAEIWSVWLLTRSGLDPIYREQFMMWLEDQLDNNVPYRDFVTGLITATGKSNDNGAVHFVFRHIGDPIQADAKGQKVDLGEFGKYDNVPVTSRVTKMFLGIQTQCTQCHDHPQAKEWLQADFWGVNAFFRQTEKVGTQNTMQKKQTATANYVELREMPDWNKKGMVLYERRDGQRKATYPVMLKDLAQSEKGEKSTKNLISAPATAKTRRQTLAEWVVQHDNFEKALVNRMWGHLFGRGLQKDATVDDFKSDNEIVHPELLTYLGEQFKQYNHDTKKLLEWLCTSDVYQLSHVALKGQADPKFDPFFARMPLKALSPEVLFDSLSLATRAESRLKDAEYKALKASWTGKLVRNFGDDEGNETTFNGTVVQALLLMNGKDLNNEVGTTRDKGVVADVVKKHRGTPSPIYDELFLMTVSRHPTREELAKLEQIRSGRATITLGSGGSASSGGKGANPPKSGPVPVPGANPDDITYYQDVFWALLNTNEFMLNH